MNFDDPLRNKERGVSVSQTHKTLKLAYYRNYCNSSQILHNDQQMLFVVVQIHVKQIQDGGGPPSWKIENRPYVSTQFGKETHIPYRTGM